MEQLIAATMTDMATESATSNETIMGITGKNMAMERRISSITAKRQTKGNTTTDMIIISITSGSTAGLEESTTMHRRLHLHVCLIW
ncbi:MAG: hypothetical protein K2J49_04925 [Muribaculaceae bacterium]|nr:hypothetical protein [Muribaculaceae bacterium]